MILFLKAVRTMLTNKRAYIACIILIAVGIMIYTSFGIAAKKLELSKEKYYEKNRMADIFATVASIPESARTSLLQTEGIEDLSFRLKFDARVDIPDSDKIITMRLVSVDTNAAYPINKVTQCGNGFSHANDLLVSEEFLTAQELSVGDSLSLIVKGESSVFNISGTGASPEFVYVIKDMNEIMPDAKSFSIGYMPLESLAVLYNMQGVYNDITFILSPSYTFDDVETALKDKLFKYGLIELTPRSDLPSNAMLESEIEGNKSMTVAISSLFILIAIIVLYLMLRRVIEQERIQIGILKAFGNSNKIIIGHYLLYGLITGLIGSIIGIVIGCYLSGEIMKMYTEFFKLPEIQTNIEFGYILTGLVMGIGGSVSGAFVSAKSIIKLLPSDAMRPAAPKNIKHDMFKILPFFKSMLAASGRMALRSIQRNKFRSFFIIIGIVFSFGMLTFMGSYNTMIDDILFDQFKKVQKYDIKVNLITPVSYDFAVNSLRGIERISITEGFLEMPVELRKSNKKSASVITGMNADSQIYKIYDNETGVNHPPPESGVILTNAIAEKLSVTRGDIVTASSPLLNEDIAVTVAGVITQNLGNGCYMERNALSKLFNMPKLVTSIGIKTSNSAYIKRYLKEGKNIASIEDKESTLNNYRDIMASYYFFIYIMQIMSMIIAFAIIYNTASISLSEREREFTTLRVLGMQVKEVGAILAFEYWTLCFIGMLLGGPFAAFLKRLMAGMIDIEMFTIPTYTPPSAYLVAVIGCLLAVFLSNRSAIRIIRKFNMVEVLKDRE